MADNLSARTSKTCNQCRARKVRCITPAGASGCASCLKRKVQCEFSLTKRLLKRPAAEASLPASASPAAPVITRLAPAPSSDLYVDRLLENPGLGGINLGSKEGVFKTQDHFVTSSNIAVFSEGRLRLISDRLGHNEVRVLVTRLTDMLDARVDRGKSKANTSRWSRMILSPPSACVVSVEDAASYVKAYFDHVHPVYPFLDRDKFEQELTHPDLNESLEGSPAFSALYHAVLALGCQYIGEWSFDTGKGQVWHLFQQSLSLLPRTMLPPATLIHLQALTAMAIFSINIPGMPFEDSLIIEAATLATQLGYHHLKNTGSPDAGPRRTFWVIYVLEKLHSFLYGRIPVLADYDIGCPIPETTEANVEGVNFFLTVIRGSRILSKSYQTLFSVSATMNSTQQYLEAIDSVRNDMSRWMDSIPIKFRPGQPFYAGKVTSTFMFMRIHYIYYALIIALCRLELHVGGVEEHSLRLTNARKGLMNTARTVIQLTTYIELKPYTPLWMLGTIPCSAMFILFDFVVHNPTHPETEANLSLMDTASGYFSRLQYATGDSLASSMLAGFAQIATEYVRKARVPASGGSNAKDSTSGLSETFTTADPNLFQSSQQAPLEGMADGDTSSELLYYPIALTDQMVTDDILAGLDFTNLFDGMIPDVG